MTWNVDDAVAELKTLADETEPLRDKKLWSSEHTRWLDRCRTSLEEIFGPEARRTKDFIQLSWIWPGPMVLNPFAPEDSIEEYNARSYSSSLDCANGILLAAIDYLQRYGMPERHLNLGEKPISPDNARIFIVHGRNEAHKNAVAHVLDQLSLPYTILHEQVDAGRTIIEKLEYHGKNSGYAIMILSADDIGGIAGQNPVLMPRARQNVILELGFFLGRLGRSRLCVLYEEDVEIPSDFTGVLYKPLDKAGQWRYALADEIRCSGFDVDKNHIR